MEFEDLLLDVGDCGKYQKHLILIFLVPAASLLPWFTMNIMFMVSVPDHWCYVPEVASSNLSISAQRSLISPPDDPCCRMYDINYTELLSNGIYTVPNDTATKPCTQGWQYDKTDYESTVATEWDLVCSDYHYTKFIQTMFYVGSILGTPMYGALSDRIGRKITFFITILVTAVSAIGSVLMKNFTAFIVFKTINGSLMPSVFQLPYIIVLEIVAPEVRTHMNGITNIAWTVGLCFLPLIAYLARSWVTLGLITSSVTLVYLLYWKMLPESPRWLVSQGKYDEALVIMTKVAEKNGKPHDPKVLSQKIEKLGEKLKADKTLRKKFLIITLCWIADICAYDGLQINVYNLAGNEFLNFFFMALAEIPGYLASWYFMGRIGRRWCAVGAFSLTGIVCMLPGIGLVNSSEAAAFMVTYQQSSELYPTVVRSLGMGMSATVASIVTILLPYIILLADYGKVIPFIIIGIICLAAGIAASFLPETLNENLPQTITDAERFGRKQKFFSWNRRKMSISRERSMKMKTSQRSHSENNEDTNLHSTATILQNADLEAIADYAEVLKELENDPNDESDNMRKRKPSDGAIKSINIDETKSAVPSSTTNDYRSCEALKQHTESEGSRRSF
ncbi:organic cation transporter protein-like [Stegodyphus dumicola]|uniref:organic cation transporter protein-like n=1 Tax=Stegodyphus dumicola TaxID=202533 RepID=UPI0015B1D191|nr:organic cation transporter protein-like [Stegodyphus dumicola]